MKEYEGVVESLEKERDFYFGKLRQIEIIIQECEQAGHVENSKVLEVLYATEVSISRPFFQSTLSCVVKFTYVIFAGRIRRA